MKVTVLVKVVFLAAFFPFIIGHGIGPSSSSTPVDPELKDKYHIMGGPTLPPGLTGEGSVVLNVNGELSSLELTGDPEASHTFTAIRILPGENFTIQYYSNVVGAKFGQTWIGRGERTKLSHSLIADKEGLFFEATYKMTPSNLSSQTASQGATMSTYILSGGSSGSEVFTTPGSFSLFLNSIEIFRADEVTTLLPIVFSASPEDTLKVVIDNVLEAGQSSQLWMHAPDGWGVRIAYPMELEIGKEFSANYSVDTLGKPGIF